MYFETYLESWDTNYLKTLQAMPINKDTLVSIAFGSFNFDNVGTIGGMSLSGDKIKEIINLVRSKGGKVKLSFGGATSPYFLSNGNQWPNLEAISDSIKTIVMKYGFDGIDLDIEEQNSSPYFAGQVTDLIKSLRSKLPLSLLTLTVPGQCWNTYWQPLTINAHPYVDALNFMEYDIWIGSTFEEQIKEDIKTYYIGQWGIPAEKITLGLMPGPDDGGKDTTLSMASNLSSWAKAQNLPGVMIWDANRDYGGLDGNPSFAYTKAIQEAIA